MPKEHHPHCTQEFPCRYLDELFILCKKIPFYRSTEERHLAYSLSQKPWIVLDRLALILHHKVLLTFLPTNLGHDFDDFNRCWSNYGLLSLYLIVTRILFLNIHQSLIICKRWSDGQSRRFCIEFLTFGSPLSMIDSRMNFLRKRSSFSISGSWSSLRLDFTLLRYLFNQECRFR